MQTTAATGSAVARGTPPLRPSAVAMPRGPVAAPSKVRSIKNWCNACNPEVSGRPVTTCTHCHNKS
jgi:hypothetical protein